MPNFGILDLHTEFLHAACHEKYDHHAEPETILKLIVNSQLLQNYFSSAKFKLLRQVKVRSYGMLSKLGRATLYILENTSIETCSLTPPPPLPFFCLEYLSFLLSSYIGQCMGL